MNTPASENIVFESRLLPGKLTSDKEKRYFPLVVIVSVLVWLVLGITVIGALYALLIGFFLWLGHGLLAAYLRSEAVRVNERQWPELYATFLEVCERLGVAKPPRLYVIQAGGALNAFATRHSGRDFVVVFSDFLEAFGPSSSEIKFILGHELGHLKSQHITKQVLLAPGLFFPLLGPAYRRSWEISCDRHGAYAAQDMGAALRAMLTLSGGKSAGRTLDAEAFASQYEEERGFFVSLHELTSTYPTLSLRVRHLRSIQTGAEATSAARNPLAYFVAMFMPGGQLGGGVGNALIIVVVIGLLAAMAIPAFQKVRQSSEAMACYNNRRMLESALDQYALEHNKAPGQWSEIVGPSKLLKAMPVCLRGGQYTAERDDEKKFEVSCSIHGKGAPQSTQPKR